MIQLNILRILLILLLLIANNVLALSNDEKMSVTGLVYKEYYYDEPNYGHTPDQDKITAACLIKLDTPLFINKKIKVSMLQLYFKTHNLIRCAQILGHRVEIIGNIRNSNKNYPHGDAILDIYQYRILH